MKIKTRIKIIVVLQMIFLFFTTSLIAQDTKMTISGTVYDEVGEQLVGATIALKKDRTQAVITDAKGHFTMKNVSLGDILLVTYMGYLPQEVKITSTQEPLVIKLESDSQLIDEVVIVGRGEQRKISVTGAITNIKGSELSAPSTTISNMLGGVVPGIISLTTSGEPGQDMSQFWIRGIGTFGASDGALVLIDGIEGNIDDIDAADVESISVLKDASATAVYGVRGANGVILITTKSGEAGKLRIMVRSNVTFSYSPRMPEYLRSYDYARMANEARLSSDMDPIYTDTEMEIIKRGLDPDLYPDVNWRKEILKDYTINHQHYMNVSGGGDVAKYFISLGMLMKDAVFKQDNVNPYDTNVKWNRYNVRAKIDANITKSTLVSVAIDGTVVDSRAPGFGENNSALWNAQANLTPLTVPVRYSNGLLPGYGKNGNQISPYVLLNHTGYKTSNRATFNMTVSLNQNFGKILDVLTGLRGTMRFNYYNNNDHNISRYKQPDAYKAYGRYNDGSLMLERTLVNQAMTYSDKESNMRRTYFDAQLNYEKKFLEDHGITAMLNYYMESEQKTGAVDPVAAISKRYQSLSARVTYGLKDTYLVEANLGYTGSENFQPGHQFGWFPSVSLGWVPTQYDFVKNALPFLSFLKIRGSYGEVGNDKIGGTRFPYLTLIKFADVAGKWGGGAITESRIGADNLEWEVAKKYNLGLEFEFFNKKVDGAVDIFKDTRDNIFQTRVLMPAEVGVVSNPFTNVGKMESGGVEGHIAFNHSFNKNNSLTVRANFTYAHNKVLHWDEDLKAHPYLSRNGYLHNINRGLIALGLFKDKEDIQASPKQTFGEVRPGDIKYKDVNGDGRINNDDIVPLKNTSAPPQIQYGFAFEYKYKNLTVSALFEGINKMNYFYGGTGYYPFSGGEQGNLLSIVGEDKNRWIPREISGDPATENPNARFPRLTYGDNANNNRASTYWLANGAYLRFRSLDIAYRINSNYYFQKIGLNSLIIQFVGNNLATWDSVKLWDPAQAVGNGASYPIQRTFSLQLTANF